MSNSGPLHGHGQTNFRPRLLADRIYPEVVDLKLARAAGFEQDLPETATPQVLPDVALAEVSEVHVSWYAEEFGLVALLLRLLDDDEQFRQYAGSG